MLLLTAAEHRAKTDTSYIAHCRQVLEERSEFSKFSVAFEDLLSVLGMEETALGPPKSQVSCCNATVLSWAFALVLRDMVDLEKLLRHKNKATIGKNVHIRDFPEYKSDSYTDCL